ncbi:MAG: hypothetical protein U1E26_08045 [Coriobacteriia bacterium]|nr:hypothetical protein [Coriobacteriia bacterium]
MSDIIRRASDYDEYSTGLCERAQLALLKCAGPWGDRVYLTGGLVPRYLITDLPEYSRPHVGTMDVDLVVGVAVVEEGPEPYDTLVANMKKAGFRLFKDEDGSEASFRWCVDIDGKVVVIEFLTEQGSEPGTITRPRQGTGAKLGAFEVRGARLVALDYVEREIRGALPDGDESFGTLRVANLVPFLTLKAMAMHERGSVKYKDAYDIVFTLSNWPGGPEAAATAAKESPIYGEAPVTEALELLAAHFEHERMDGPGQYSSFLFDEYHDEEEEEDRLRLEAVSVVRSFLRAL